MESLVTMLSDMVIDIKEEDPNECAQEEVQMNKEIESKMAAMKETMAKRAVKIELMKQKKQKLLEQNHRIYFSN